jgi:hypothetical protein
MKKYSLTDQPAVYESYEPKPAEEAEQERERLPQVSTTEPRDWTAHLLDLLRAMPAEEAARLFNRDVLIEILKRVDDPIVKLVISLCR